MKFSGAIRKLLVAFLLSFTTWSAQAAVDVFNVTSGFPGGGFQFKFYDFLIGSPTAPLGGAATATLTDTGVLSPFTSLGLAIFKTGGSPVAPTLFGPGSFDFSVAPGAVGSYTALVFGVPGDPNLSVFGVNVSIVPTIPEPEIWALMLVGTGLVGFQLRRKRKAAEANRLAA